MTSTAPHTRIDPLHVFMSAASASATEKHGTPRGVATPNLRNISLP